MPITKPCSPLPPNLGISHFRARRFLLGVVLQDEPIGCLGCLELRNSSVRPGQLTILGFAPTSKLRKSAEEGVGGWLCPATAWLGSHGEESLLSLNCLWSLFLHMALVFQFRRPVGAQPLPGLCQGKQHIRTNSCGKCVCCVAAVCVLCGVAQKEKLAWGDVSLWLCSACRVVCGHVVGKWQH